MQEKIDILKRIEEAKDWSPPGDWQKINTIDMHTAGEPLRVFLSGYPNLRGKTVLAKRLWAKENYDDLRTALMWEPRGHADMYGCIISPPTLEEADLDVIFLHNEGYATMCGHAIIAITKLAVELNLVEISRPTTPVRINAPAGVINSFAEIDKFGKADHIYFHNVPSFVLALDAQVNIPELGPVTYDLAYGGAFYAFVRAQDVELECTPKYFNQLIEKGMLIKHAVQATGTVKHPFEKDLGFLYGTIFLGEALNGGDSRNVCIFAEGEVDRSPTGTGVSARMAIHYARKEIGLNEPMTVESILGTKFTGSVIKESSFGPHRAVVPKVEGTSHFIGRSEFFIDPEDPLRNGFVFR